MFKKSLLLVVALAAAVNAWAAPVDVATAKATAQQYLTKQYAGKSMAPAATEPVLIKTEMGKVNKETPVFYIFNTSTTFVVVSGDDRAKEVLAVGDQPLDLNRIPDGLKEMFSCYTEELDWLISNPDVQVEKTVSTKASGAKAVTYGPLLTCNWDQSAPYYNQCKFTYNNSTYQCLTGCPATSASMVLYYWKWPTAQVAAISSYTAELNLSYYNSVSSFTYPALSATTFDWANMKDTYNSYTTAQGTAVATLMRYVGQAEHMMYGTESAGGSGIYTTDTQNIVDMFTLFGYDSSTCRVAKKSSYSTTNWATLIKNEMAEGRPIVFMAVSSSAGGHAFNVDGYRDSDDTYHVNFGWSGDGNAWCAMNSFGYSGYTFNSDQQAVVGIKPSADYFGPTITTSESSLAMESTVGQSTTSTFTVTGSNLTSNVTLSVSGTGFTVSPTTITASEAAAGKTVTVTYAPTAAGTNNGTITLKSTGASDVTVSLAGTAKYAIDAPVLNTASNINSTGFTATWTHNPPVDVTYSLRVMRNGQNVQAPTGITGKSYTVTGLTTGYTYTVQVKAVPTNTSLANESGWSNQQSVTTVVVPVISTSATSVDFGTLNVGQNNSKTVTITGTNLNGNITAALNDANGVFAITPTTITPTQATSGQAITVTFTPKANVDYTATITLTSSNAETKTVTLTGKGAYVDPVMQPADESYININKFRAEWTDATPAANVASYTLQVNYVTPEPPAPEYELISSIAGTDFTGSSSGYYSITLPDPWGGTEVRGGLNSIIYFRNYYNGSSVAGNITYTIPAGYENQTFTVKITTANDNDGSGNLTVATPQTSAVGHNFAINETYAWKVTASSGEKITITTTDNNYSPDIAKIEIYRGDATSAAKASETGDQETRTVTGITNKYYDVANLIDEGTYTYKVKAVYTNGSESNWSNIEQVTLFGNQTYIVGDVNLDGDVNVVDITALIDFIMNDTTGENADVNGDGEINVVDITALIDIIMNM